jgi:hypothetical protein
MKAEHRKKPLFIARKPEKEFSLNPEDWSLT